MDGAAGSSHGELDYKEGGVVTFYMDFCVFWTRRRQSSNQDDGVGST